MTYELLPKDFNPDAKTTNRDIRRRREAKRNKSRAVRRANRDIARLAAEGDTFSADAVSPDPRSGWVD